jgi:hypothetical protein
MSDSSKKVHTPHRNLLERHYDDIIDRIGPAIIEYT